MIALNNNPEILIIRLDRIGDVVLTTPMIHAIRNRRHACHITLIVQPETHDIVKHNPDINEIIEFIIQLEIFIKGKWHPIIRYDTSHKFAHCDILHWKGRIEKLAMPTLDFRDALIYADNDLSQNWAVYHERFLKEVINNGK